MGDSFVLCAIPGPTLLSSPFFPRMDFHHIWPRHVNQRQQQQNNARLLALVMNNINHQNTYLR